MVDTYHKEHFVDKYLDEEAKKKVDAHPKKKSRIEKLGSKVYQKMKAYGEEKPKPTAKPTAKPKPTMWIISIEKDGVQQNRYFQTLADASSSKAGFVANGYRILGMRKHNVLP